MDVAQWAPVEPGGRGVRWRTPPSRLVAPCAPEAAGGAKAWWCQGLVVPQGCGQKLRLRGARSFEPSLSPVGATGVWSSTKAWCCHWCLKLVQELVVTLYCGFAPKPDAKTWRCLLRFAGVIGLAVLVLFSFVRF